jgi:hypothetical protein
MSVDLVLKTDTKIFGQVVQDFVSLQKIQLWSDFCNMQQLERQDRLIEMPENKKQDFELRKISQNVQDNTFIIK